MVADHYREREREDRKREELAAHEPAESGPAEPEENQRFRDCWRQELINQAWEALRQAECNTSQPYASLLRLQEEQPGLRSPNLPEQLTSRLGRPSTPAGVRRLVHPVQ